MIRRLGIAGSALMTAERLLIETIIRTSSLLSGGWRLVDQGDVDVLLVNKLTDNDEAFNCAPHTVKVLVRRRDEPCNGLVFYRPLRADEFIAVLQQASRQIDGDGRSQPKQARVQRRAATGTTTSRYRLRKWPPSSLLASFPVYKRLAAYLSRSPKSLDELMAFSGLNKSRCEEFIANMISRNLLLVESSAQAPVKAAAVSQQKLSFLSQLRQRFGVGKRG